MGNKRKRTLEEIYDQEYGRLKTAEKPVEEEGLPVKGFEGKVKRRKVQMDDTPQVQITTKFDKVAKAQSNDKVLPTKREEKEEKEKIRVEKEELSLQKKKEKIASLATLILSEPSQNVRSLAQLQEFCMDPNLMVQKIAMLSLCSLFQDITPGYTINVHQYDNETKLSTRVEELKFFELNLVKQYQVYLQFLHNIILKRGHTKLFFVAVQCISKLLEANFLFNFSDNVIEVILPLLNDENPKVRRCAFEAFTGVFQEDKSYLVSSRIVEQISTMIKKLKYDVEPEAIDCFLFLPLTAQLRDKFIPKDITVKNKWKRKKKFTLNVETQFQRDMRELRGSHTLQSKFKYQTHILRNIIVTYVRLLKSDLQSPLLFCSLQGLGKFSHLMNIELLYDLLDFIRSTLSEPKENLPTRTALQILATADRLLQGLGATINIDLQATFTTLYNIISDVVLFEPTAENFKLLIQVLHKMLIEHGGRDLPDDRIAAFVKRLSTYALYCPVEMAICFVSIVNALFSKYKRSLELLDEDSAGIMNYEPDIPNPDQSNPFATSCWEFLHLARHYHPHLAKLIDRTVKTHKEAVRTEQHLIGTLTLEDFDHLIEQYSRYNGTFYPAIRDASNLNQYEKKLKKNPEKNVFVHMTEYSKRRDTKFWKEAKKALQQDDTWKEEFWV